MERQVDEALIDGPAHASVRSGLGPGRWAAMIAAVAAAVVLSVFATQNSEQTTLHFFGATSEATPLFVAIFVAAALGLVLGLLLAASLRRHP